MMTGKKGEEGQSLVEFALVIPLFLGLVLGLVSFAPAWERHLALNNATRAAARVMATCRFAPSTGATSAVTAANTIFAADQPSGFSGTPTITVGNASPWEVCNDNGTGTDTASGGDKITVTASLPVKIGFLGVTFLNTSITSTSISTAE